MSERPLVPPGSLQSHRLGLADAADVGEFRCGDDDLEAFLRDDAFRLQAADTVRTYLARDRGELVGYLALLADAIVLESRERARLALTHADHPVIPALKVARLAVTERHRKAYRGTGQALMRFAFELGLDVSDRVGCRVLTVDAYPATIGFYERLGFLRNRSKEYRGRARPSMRFDLRADPLPSWAAEP